MNRWLMLVGVFCGLTHALSDGEAEQYRERFKENNAHMVNNGREIDLYVPIKQLYFEQTNYFLENIGSLLSDIEGLVKLSTGKIELVGYFDERANPGSFDGSALYSQVANFSTYLLKHNTDVSYSPITIQRYVKNDSYGFWGIFTDETQFVKLSFQIDL